MKQVIEEKKVFRSEIMTQKEVMIKFKEVFLLLKMSFKVSLKKYTGRKQKGKFVLVAC